MQARDDEIAALREQSVQRSREAAELAKRRFMEVDPGNRLVADVLESEWNRSLQALRDAENERDRLRDQDGYCSMSRFANASWNSRRTSLGYGTTLRRRTERKST